MPQLRILLLLLLGLVLGAQDRVVVLLRHGEKLGRLPGADLSAAGRARAEALVGPLSAFRPVRLFASDLPRTQQTLAPLSRRLGLGLQVRPREAVAALAEEIRSLPVEGTVVVCGHSDTLGPLVRALGHPTGIPEVRTFDRLWVLRLGPAEGPLLEERRQAPVPESRP